MSPLPPPPSCQLCVCLWALSHAASVLQCGFYGISSHTWPIFARWFHSWEPNVLCRQHWKCPSGPHWNQTSQGLLLLSSFLCNSVGKCSVCLFRCLLSHDAEAWWENDSVSSPQRKPECYFGHLYSKSPLVKYQPKISSAWVFFTKPFQAFLMAVSVWTVYPTGVGSTVNHCNLRLASKKFLLWFFLLCPFVQPL